MTDVRDPASLIDAAQKAVGDGDYLEAERLLGEAAAIQETTLGDSHPDLATTLNNLAFVCERTSKFDDAERGYRRAHKIAVASLSPGHPFIKTSLSNLMEFCEARGIPIWTPPETPLEDEPLPDDDIAVGPSPIEPSPIEVPPAVAVEPAVTSRLPMRMMAAAALVVAAIVVIVFVAGPPGPAVRAGQAQETRDVPRTAAIDRSEPVPPDAPAISETTAPVAPPAPEPTVPPAPRREPETAPATTTAPVSVLQAQLCSALEKRGSPDWQCTAASGDLQPGTYMFYTRLLTTSATTVEHRWYRGDRVHQTMRLRVPASAGNGYRTFSSNSVSAERAGEWKVELRTVDGTLLDEARFVVR